MAAVAAHTDGRQAGEQGSAVDAAARERRCIVTRLSQEATGLIRFARAPDGTVVPDIKETLPGRGCWIAAERALVERAVDKRLFARAFKAECKVAVDLPDMVERLLRDDTLGLLALSRKAGQLVLGEMQVVAAARETPLACVIHASDGAANGLKKVLAALGAAGQRDHVPVIEEFTSDELSLALGLPNVIHAALPAGRLGQALAEKARKLAAYRGKSGGNTASFTTDRQAGPADIGQDPGS